MNICVNKHPLQIEASVSNGYDNKSLGGILLLCSSRRIIEVDFQLDTLSTCPQVHNAITSGQFGLPYNRMGPTSNFKKQLPTSVTFVSLYNQYFLQSGHL